MTTPLTLRELNRIAALIDEKGLGAVPDRLLADVVGHAARLGVGAVAAEVLLDADAPRPVRERAFGRLTVHIARADRPTDRGVPCAA